MEAPLLSCDQALATVAAACNECGTPSSTEQLPLDAALQRVLAADIIADRDQPPFARSTRDGFAVRAADLGVVDSFRVLGTVRAGSHWTGGSLERGEALEIMTGAPMPVGADAVLMVEHSESSGNTMRTGRALAHGENVIPRGAEVKQGEILLAAGTRLGAAELALAASAGAAELQVFERPLVAILSTGDEIVPVSSMPEPHQIRNSNAHALAALVRQHGGTPQLLPIAHDTATALEQALDQAAGACLLLITGGVSAGKYDLVEPVLLSRAASFRFTGVAMQPGKPVVFGSRKVARQAEPDVETQWLFGLPGNPISTQVTATLFAMPLLRALGGELAPVPAFCTAAVEKDVISKPGLTRFLPARLTGSLHGATVRPTGWQGSGDLAANARANCYLVVPPGETLHAGGPGRVLLR